MSTPEKYTLTISSIEVSGTVTSQVANLPPADAVMVAVPAARAVTVPLDTVATDVLEDVQVTVLSVALSGSTVARRVSELPGARVNAVLSRVIEETGTVPGSAEDSSRQQRTLKPKAR